MATVRNKTSQPVAVTLKTGTGFYFAPKQTRIDFPNNELDGPYFKVLVQNRTLMVVSTDPYVASAPTTAPTEAAPAEAAPVDAASISTATRSRK